MYCIVLYDTAVQATRRLRRSPGFAATTILTLGLALAANATIFSLVNGILLRPLPYENAAQLVVIKHALPALDTHNALQSTGTYFHYREHADSFADMGLYRDASVNLTGNGDAEQIRLIMTTPSVFSTLGVAPLHGRLFTEADSDPGREPVVMLTHSLWRDRYGSDSSIVGRDIYVNDAAREVVGVLAPGFDFPTTDIDMWMSDSDIAPQHARFAELTYGNVARLRRGVSLSEAEAELRALAPSLGDAYGDISPEMLEQTGFSAHIVTLEEDIVGDVDEVLWIWRVARSLSS